MEQNNNRSYFAVQNDFVKLMAASGYFVDVRTRLPIFALFHRLGKVQSPPQAQEAAAKLRFLLCELLDLRKAGQEPPHQNGRYT